MSSRFTLIGSVSLLLFVGLCAGGLWSLRCFLSPQDATVLSLEAPAPAEGVLGQPLTVDLAGRGVGAGIRAWLVPELTHRQGVVGSVKTWGAPLDMVRRGNLGYLANGLGGFMIVDLSNPSRPEVLSAVDTPGQGFAIALLENFAYLADGQGGLQVFEVDDPASSRLVTSLATKGATLGVATLPGLVLLADGKGGLQILDAGDPGRPVPIGALPLPGFARSVAAAKGHAYVALGENGLAVVDLSRPQRPREVGWIAEAGTVSHVAAASGRLLVAMRPLSKVSPWVLRLFDLQTAGSPTPVGEFILAGHPVGISYDGQRAAVALSADGLQVVDFSVPERPREVGTFEFSDTVRCSILDGDILWAGNGTSKELLAFDLSRQIEPAVNRLNAPATVRALRVTAGERMLLSLSGLGVEIFDIADPRRPNRLGLLPTPGDVLQMVCRDNLLFLGILVDKGATQGMLMVADIADPQNPTVLSTLDLPLLPMPIVATGDHLAVGLQPYLAGGQVDTAKREEANSLYLVDVSDPRQPKIRGQLRLTAQVNAMAVRGTQLFVKQGNNEFLVVDSRDPDQLRPLGTVKLPWLHRTTSQINVTIVLRDDQALVVEGMGGIKVIDIAKPSRPRVLGACFAGKSLLGAVLDGETLYLGLLRQGMLVAEFSEAEQARVVGELPLPANGGYPFVADGHFWLVRQRGSMVVQIAPQPMEVETIPFEDGSGLTLRLPSPSMPGDYTLWIEQGGERLELPGCVRFREA